MGNTPGKNQILYSQFKFTIAMKEVKFTNSGLRFEGEWEDICAFAKKLEEIMDEYINDQEEIEEYEYWRPHLEDTDEKMIEKTAEEASIDEKKIEKNVGITEYTENEINDAEKKLKKSAKKISHGEDPSTEIKDALQDIEEVVEVESIRSVKKIEKIIYKKLMLRFNPLYFDKEDFSVNLDRKNEAGYILGINISDDKLREHFKAQF